MEKQEVIEKIKKEVKKLFLDNNNQMLWGISILFNRQIHLNKMYILYFNVFLLLKKVISG